MIDLLVLSHSCLTAINRRPYRLLSEGGISAEIVLPHRIDLGNGIIKTADPRRAGDPVEHVLHLVGKHPRLWHYDGLMALLQARRPRIVLIDGDPGGRLSADVGVWARWHGAKVACISCDNMDRTLRGELDRSLRDGLKHLAAEALGRASRAVVDHVFAISPDVQQVMLRRGFGPARCSVMPLGFEPTLFRPNAQARARVRAELGLDKTTIGYFGRVSPEKGVHHLVQTLGLMRDEPWQLLLDEPPPSSAYAADILRQLESLGLRSRTIVFRADHDEIADVMNAADIVVAPSASRPGWKEQYGRVVPEAMACAKAVVTTPCGALPWLVADAGLIVPEADPGSLANALARLLASVELRAELGQRAVQRALALSLSVQVEVMQRVFADWLARP